MNLSTFFKNRNASIPEWRLFLHQALIRKARRLEYHLLQTNHTTRGLFDGIPGFNFPHNCIMDHDGALN